MSVKFPFFGFFFLGGGSADFIFMGELIPRKLFRAMITRILRNPARNASSEIFWLCRSTPGSMHTISCNPSETIPQSFFARAIISEWRASPNDTPNEGVQQNDGGMGGGWCCAWTNFLDPPGSWSSVLMEVRATCLFFSLGSRFFKGPTVNVFLNEIRVSWDTRPESFPLGCFFVFLTSGMFHEKSRRPYA